MSHMVAYASFFLFITLRATAPVAKLFDKFTIIP